MLIATNGRIVIGYNVYVAGDEIAGLDGDAEERLIAAGLAERVAGSFDLEPVGCDSMEAEPDEAEPEAVALGELSKDELKARCRDLGLPTSGNKDELIARIEDAELAEDDGLDGDEPPMLTAEVPQ